MTQATTFRDRYGLPLSTTSAIAVEHYVDGVDRVLSRNVDADVSFRRAIEADGGFALAHSALAVALRELGRLEEARAIAGRARSLTAGISPRERQHVEAIAVLASGEGHRAFGLMREHLNEFPRDALILAQARQFLFFSGGENRQQQEFDLFQSFASHYADDWWFLGQYAFTHGELCRFREGQRLAERSLALYRRNYGAAHALGHILYDVKENEAGAAFLGDWVAAYDRRAPSYGHISWHLALFELGVGHYQRVTELYNLGIGPVVSKYRGTLANAASLLWRCQLYGSPPSAQPWEELQGLAMQLAENPRGEFDDLNAALAFAAAGNEAGLRQQVESLRGLVAKGHHLAGEVAVPLAQGVGAFSQGDYEQAIRLMEPVLDRIEGVGGSNAQQEVFQDTLLEAYLRTERFDEAEAMMRKRMEPRATPRDLLRLGRAQLGNGKVEEATTSLREALQRWPDADGSSSDLASIAALAQRYGLTL